MALAGPPRQPAGSILIGRSPARTRTWGALAPDAATIDRSQVLQVAALLAFFGLVYALLARLILHAFPFSGDEYSALLQAEVFARGLLRVPAPPHADLLQVDHVVIDDWVRSKYPPGTSALLALGVRAGVAWLVTPLEGVLALGFTWRAARALLDHRSALVVVGFLGAAPLFAFQAATFYSHTPTTMWLAVALAALACWTFEPRPFQLVVFGAAVGCAFLTRPLDAVLFGAALVSLRSARALVLAAVGAAPFVGLGLVYQAAQFGSPFMDGYRVYGATFRALYDENPAVSQIALRHAVDGMELWNHADILRAFVLDWTVPAAVVLAVFGWVRLGRDPRALPLRRFAGVVMSLFCVVLLFTMATKDDGARPRYLSTVLLPFALLAGAGWFGAAEALREHIGRRATLAVGALVGVVMPVLQLAAVLDTRIMALAHRQGLYETARAIGGQSAVVIVRTPYPTRFSRNGPWFDGRVLYVATASNTPAAEVARAFPGRAIFEARERINEHNSELWEIARVNLD